MAFKLLCAVDGSDHSKEAVEFAASMAKKLDADLTLLAVIPVTLGRGVKQPLWTESEARKILDSAAKAAKKAGLKDVDTMEAAARDVAGAILTVAEDQDFDHIVVGSGGKSAATRLLIGSVSTDVVNKAHCPVTVVH
jgi:nucleotide-binding universal stress UspA family protein